MKSSQIFTNGGFQIFHNPLEVQPSEVQLKMEIFAFRDMLLQSLIYLDDLLQGDPYEYHTRVDLALQNTNKPLAGNELPGLQSLKEEIPGNPFAFAAAFVMNYVDLVNSGANMYLLNRQNSFRVLAFLVANKLHYYLVGKTLDSIERHGPEFGQNTEAQKADVQSLVWHWPKTFGFEDQIPEVRRVHTPATQRAKAGTTFVTEPKLVSLEGGLEREGTVSRLLPSGYQGIGVVYQGQANFRCIYEHHIRLNQCPWSTAILVADPLVKDVHYLAVKRSELDDSGVKVLHFDPYLRQKPSEK